MNICVDVCDEGFARSADHNFECQPTCNQCEYGDCLKPGVCECWPEYRLIEIDSNSTTCEPTCEQCESPNTCHAPHKCLCEPGYDSATVEIPGSYTAEICQPHCDSPCNNGYCSSPNNCTCRDGFIQTKNESCELPCPNECLNGICEMGQCKCHAGYELHNDSDYDCQPQCDPACTDGYCHAPNTCQCFDGFELQNGTCIANCSTECENGKCLSHEKCDCNDGYHLQFNKPHVCIPICGGNDTFDDEDDGCVNGTCIAPNRCQCEPGFRLYDDNHTCHIDNEYIFAADGRNPLRTSFLIIFAILLTLCGIVAIYFFTVHTRGKHYDIYERGLLYSAINKSFLNFIPA